MTILKKAGAMIFVDDKTSCFSSQKLTNREEIQPKIKRTEPNQSLNKSFKFWSQIIALLA
ncbi:hypothetical protein BSO15_06560 [Haemophilus parainfluenzae]|jgi:hypothetical protein|uniref:Uncharacterized protein n=1 Tax=Haemophilus parainfluenzae TaxID=729 RepID=A0AB36IM52_HAEPA|nr:hypothetical protein BSO15_06560 [Haemophilus parainfluenzae]